MMPPPRLLPLAAALLLLAGCAATGEQPALRQPVAAESLGLSRQPLAPIPADWWRGLNDPTLNRLLETTLQQSPDLDVAAARLRQAQAAIELADSQLGPQAALAADGNAIYHDSLSQRASIVSQLFGETISRGSLQLKGQWSLDLWGQHRSESAAALGKERATAYETAHARLLLAQAVTAQYLQLQALQTQQALLQQRLAVKNEQEPLLRDRIRAGYLPASQLYPLQSAQRQFQVAIHDLDHKAAQIRHALAALSGQSPTALAALTAESPRPLPPPPAHTLSADLLGKRPDIAAQRAAILARGHLVDAARARFYPDIKISALAGWSTIKIGELPSSRSLIAGLLPSISLPIFTSGALRANLAQKQAEFDEQVARYNKTVYQALREAADALSHYQAAQTAGRLQQDTVRLAERSAAAARDRFRGGLDTKLAWLSAQDEVLNTRSQLEQSRLQQRLAWISLHTAFGGGFSSPDTQAAETAR
ncbi:efflux transporter outer membrane subunit [Neisseria shayeganii]|nr:efflux transporter outer membrane subunit [Neisseria shayeganii]